MSIKMLLTSTILGLALSTAVGSAQAAPVLGSHVDSADFTAAIGSTSGWSYVGQNTVPFVGSGEGLLELRSAGANADNSFGFARTNHTGMTTVFGTGASVGASGTVSGYTPSYLFYFNSGLGISFIDGNTQFTDGTSSGGLLNGQGDIDIFRNLAANSWAFFFDDGGPSGLGDDGDYNDMVVSFTQRGVPEPATLSLFGLGLLAAGMARRFKRT